MSSGPFTLTFYETNEGDIARVRVQPETLSTDNPPATGPADFGVRATVSGSRRQLGRLFTRGVYVYREIGAGETLSRRFNFIPILTPTAFAALSEGDTITAGGQTWTVSGFRAQKPANV